MVVCLVCAEGVMSPEKSDSLDGNTGNQRLASLQKQLDIENKVP